MHVRISCTVYIVKCFTFSRSRQSRLKYWGSMNDSTTISPTGVVATRFLFKFSCNMKCKANYARSLIDYEHLISRQAT